MKILKKISLLFSDTLLTYLLFIYKHRYLPSFRKPTTLNEKVNAIKLYSRYELRALVVDRVKVREYVKSLSPDCELIPIVWTGKKLSTEDFKKLPPKFVVKANHGSGMVKLCTKSQVNVDSLNAIFEEWLNIDYSSLGREWFYRDVDRLIIIEEMLNFSGDTPPDYKFFATRGNVFLVQLDLDRFKGHKRNVYDRDFNLLDIKIKRNNGPLLEKPSVYNRAREIAEQLSVDFDFIRVDLYLIDDKVYFGELTNVPGNGFEKIYPKKADYDLAKNIPVLDECK